MITQLGKDLYNAQYRVLDHKVFVSGEIERFLNNFEEQRNDSEVESLFKVTETVGALKYELSDRCINLGSTYLSEIATELNDILLKVDNLLTTLQIGKPENHVYSESQLARKRRKEQFEQELKHNYQRVESSFAVKEEEISELYSDLQIKLNILK